MKINDIYESTTSGSIATVAQPMSGRTQRHSNTGTGVYSSKKSVMLSTGKKNNKSYTNSVLESKRIEEAQLDEEDKLIDPNKGKKRKTGLHGKQEERKLSTFKHPFVSSGVYISDSRRNKICECENEGLAKEVTKALNAYVKQNESTKTNSIAKPTEQ